MPLRKQFSQDSGLLKIMDRLTFEPHRLRLDPTGHYEERLIVLKSIVSFYYRRTADIGMGQKQNQKIEFEEKTHYEYSSARSRRKNGMPANS